jgi:hypothetical protein
MENETLTKKSQPPYLLGLLCLIPLVGAFVGIGLLLYGIIKYKDKWLIAIGIFGILFTVFVYSSLFFAVTHVSLFKKGFADISKIQIRQVVMGIEFYKLQHGHYPDSLKQLQEVDKLVPINDAATGMQLIKHGNYNYKRIGDKYTLFSSGIDGIAGTKDDFYPEMEIRGSSKIGLIKLK